MHNRVKCNENLKLFLRCDKGNKLLYKGDLNVMIIDIVKIITVIIVSAKQTFKLIFSMKIIRTSKL